MHRRSPSSNSTKFVALPANPCIEDRPRLIPQNSLYVHSSTCHRSSACISPQSRRTGNHAKLTTHQCTNAQRTNAQRTNAQRTNAQRTNAQRTNAQRTNAQRTNAPTHSMVLERSGGRWGKERVRCRAALPRPSFAMFSAACLLPRHCPIHPFPVRRGWDLMSLSRRVPSRC